MTLGQNEKGFTFLELLICFIILGLFINAGYALLESGIYIWSRGEKNLDVQQNMRLAMEKILKDVYLAQGLEPGIERYNFVLSEKELVLRNIDGTLMAYYLDETNGILYRFANGGRNPLAYEIKDVKFIYNREPWYLSNLVTMELIGGQDGKEYRLRSSAKIRLLP